MYYNKYINSRQKSAAKPSSQKLQPHQDDVIIDKELSLTAASSCPAGAINLEDFKYEPYNNDFGPLTIHDVVTLTQMISRKRTSTNLHMGINKKSQSRAVCLVACYLMNSKKYSET